MFFCFSSLKLSRIPNLKLRSLTAESLHKVGPLPAQCISGMVAHGTQLRGTSRTSSAFRSVGETEIFWYVMPQCMGIFTYIFAGYQTFAAFWLVILTDRDFPCNTVDGRNPAI